MSCITARLLLGGELHFVILSTAIRTAIQAHRVAHRSGLLSSADQVTEDTMYMQELWHSMSVILTH